MLTVSFFSFSDWKKRLKLPKGFRYFLSSFPNSLKPFSGIKFLHRLEVPECHGSIFRACRELVELDGRAMTPLASFFQSSRLGKKNLHIPSPFVSEEENRSLMGLWVWDIRWWVSSSPVVGLASASFCMIWEGISWSFSSPLWQLRDSWLNSFWKISFFCFLDKVVCSPTS